MCFSKGAVVDVVVLMEELVGGGTSLPAGETSLEWIGERFCLRTDEVVVGVVLLVPAVEAMGSGEPGLEPVLGEEGSLEDGEEDE